MTARRIALLGVAHVHAEGYAAWLSVQADVEVIGFAEDDPEVAQDFEATTGLQWRPLPGLLAARPHGVIVCGETVQHRTHVEGAARAGAHVLCEKPLATTLEDAQALLDACTRAGVTLHTAFPVRYSPAVRQLRAHIQGGDLGDLLAYSGVNHSVSPDHERAWFSDLALAGGGAGMDHIIHLADLLHHLGERVQSIHARLIPVPAWTIPGHEQTDAAGLVTLKLASGAVATVDCSWSRPRAYPRWGHLKLDVTGTAGMRSLDAFAEHLSVTTGQGRRWAGYGADLNAAMLRDFLTVCGGGEAGLLASGQDGLEALRVVLAAYESERAGRVVELSADADAAAR
ncbi:Gfo/Idh/MocA family protein [Deinococcus koreensis]|uniref:Gfo/Idh/MocA family oxidoreductase n=1 Tax=Deinococcus koreensis TaxID=2054903 RepID=A0A2K3UYR8_9DEIO|nr:Gfo/Idh/MocA family oxidoreductase [Deinococcus koreensis]PNY81672.1 gfo/Idh/MocA family oxidoreductase [Deinococcus koreensis]